MSDVNGQSELATRLRKLPARIGLALINATVVLVIVATVLVIVALNRVENAAARISASMTDAVLSNVDVNPTRLIRNLRETESNIRDLRTAIREGGAQRTEKLEQVEKRVATLTETLTGLRGDVKTLTEAKARLTDEAVREIGRAATDGLLQLRGCRPVQ